LTLINVNNNKYAVAFDWLYRNEALWYMKLREFMSVTLVRLSDVGEILSVKMLHLTNLLVGMVRYCSVALYLSFVFCLFVCVCVCVCVSDLTCTELNGTV
jgi:hypothetical protein